MNNVQDLCNKLEIALSAPGNIKKGTAPGSSTSINSRSISDNSFAEGLNCTSGSKAFKVLGLSIFPDSFNLNGFTITTEGGKIATSAVDNYLKLVHQVEWNLSRFTTETYLGFYVVNDIENVKAGMVCYPHFENSRGSVEFIVESTSVVPYGNVIVTANFDPNSKLYVDSNNAPIYKDDKGEEHNYLTILARPDLGDMAIGKNAHAEGEITFAQDKDTHAGGLMSVAAGKYGFSHGVNAISGYCAFAMGYDVAAVAIDSFAIGKGSISNGYTAFAGGIDSYALGAASFAFGENAIAYKIDSKALGMGCWALGENQFVTGKYNILDPDGKYAFILGNGRHNGDRSDAFKADWDGNCFVTGNVYVDAIEGQELEGRRLVTKAELDNAFPKDVTTLSWTEIQELVRSGAAPYVIDLGQEFKVKHSEYGDANGDIIFEVVAFDHFKSVDGDEKPTMTLLSKNVIGSWTYEYDAAEKPMAIKSFSVVSAPVPLEGEMPKTNYVVYTPEGGGMYFASKKAFPAGLAFVYPINPSNGEFLDLQIISGNFASGNPADISIVTSQYIDSATWFQSIDEVPFEGWLNINAGSALVDVAINTSDRVSYGSNNYGESAIRQFLNSTQTAGNWWTAQTPLDNPPSYSNTKNGFLYGLDSEFFSVIGSVKVPCAYNGVFEYGNVNVNSSYIVEDKFYLPSYVEVIGYQNEPNMVNDGSRRLAFYENATAEQRIKENIQNGLDDYWMLRTPQANSVYSEKVMNSSGGVSQLSAFTKCAFAPMCTIV